MLKYIVRKLAIEDKRISRYITYSLFITTCRVIVCGVRLLTVWTKLMYCCVGGVAGDKVGCDLGNTKHYMAFGEFQRTLSSAITGLLNFLGYLY